MLDVHMLHGSLRVQEGGDQIQADCHGRNEKRRDGMPECQISDVAEKGMRGGVKREKEGQ